MMVYGLEQRIFHSVQETGTILKNIYINGYLSICQGRRAGRSKLAAIKDGTGTKNKHKQKAKEQTTMVILAAAALTAAGVGAYQGGKAAVQDTSKRLRRAQTHRVRQHERQEEERQRTVDQDDQLALRQSMSVKDRLATFKRGIPEQGKKKKGAFGRRN